MDRLHQIFNRKSTALTWRVYASRLCQRDLISAGDESNRTDIEKGSGGDVNCDHGINITDRPMIDTSQ